MQTLKYTLTMPYSWLWYFVEVCESGELHDKDVFYQFRPQNRELKFVLFVLKFPSDGSLSASSFQVWVTRSHQLKTQKQQQCGLYSIPFFNSGARCLLSLCCALSSETQWDGFVRLKIQVSKAVHLWQIYLSKWADVVKYSQRAKLKVRNGLFFFFAVFFCSFCSLQLFVSQHFDIFLWFEGLHWCKSDIVSLLIESRPGLYKSEVVYICIRKTVRLR